MIGSCLNLTKFIMSIGGGHPDVSGMELARTIVLPRLLEDRIDSEQVDALNDAFSLGLNERILADIEGNVDLIRERFAAFFNGEGDEWAARSRFHVLIDLIDEMQDLPDHKRRVVRVEASDLRRQYKALMRKEMEDAPWDDEEERDDCRTVARRKVMKELGLWDGLGEVVEGKEALLKAFDATWRI